MILPPNNYLITNYVDEQQEQRMHPTYASVIQQRANIKFIAALSPLAKFERVSEQLSSPTDYPL